MGECCPSRRPFWNGIGRSICPRWWRQPEPFSRIRCSVTLLNVCFTRPKCTASNCCPAFAMLSSSKVAPYLEYTRGAQGRAMPHSGGSASSPHHRRTPARGGVQVTGSWGCWTAYSIWPSLMMPYGPAPSLSAKCPRPSGGQMTPPHPPPAPPSS